jgi:hypothetical protein
MTRRAALVLALLAGAVAPALAEDSAACYGPELLSAKTFVQPALKLVAPDAPKRLRFAKGGLDAPGCPSAEEKCQEKAFVTPGDAVVVGVASGAFVCATFTAPNQKAVSTNGWLPRAALVDAPTVDEPSVADWSGEWRSGEEKQISIVAAGPSLAVRGEATYGASDAGRAERGAVNMGQIAAKVAPVGREASFAQGDGGETMPVDAARKSDADVCRVRMWRFGDYLVASDNAACGGMNVTFAGVYRRE